MRKLLGPHLGGQWMGNLDILRRWQPPLALVLQPEVDKVKQLREACPNTIIVGRFYHDDSHYAINISSQPVEFAHEIHKEIANNPTTPLLDYVQSNNEVCQDWQGIQKLNQFTQEWMFLADQSQAYKCAILAFSVGNPDLPHKPGDPAGFDGRMLYWQQVLPSLNYAQRHNHILLLHAYGFPDMFRPNANWYIYRYERQVQANLRMLGITNLKYAYGEIGIDRLIVNDKGGYKVVTNDQDYVNQLLQWERDQQSQSLLLGGAIFTFGDSGGWDTYDITSTNVANMLATHYVNHAGNYDGSSTPANQDEDTFLPSVGTGEFVVTPPPSARFGRSVEQDAHNYGVRIRPFPTTGLSSSDLVWIAERVERLHEKEGEGRHHFYFETVDANGQRLTGVPIKVWWPDGEDVVKSEAKPGEPWSANKPFSPGRNAFNAQVLSGKASDIVVGAGMGEDYPEGFNTNVHSSITVRWVQRPYGAQVAPQPEPGQGAAYVLPDIGVNIRSTPDTSQDNILRTAPQGERLTILRFVEGVDGKQWAVVRGQFDSFTGVVRADLLSVQKPEQPQPAPSEPAPQPVATPSTPVASGIIDPLTALAFLQVESGNRAFTDGLLTIRFEVHRFKANLKNDALFDKHFAFVPGKYAEQYWRPTPDGAWIHAHGSMAERHKLLNFAMTLNQNAALRSTGMGTAQIMGENHARIGYATPQAMFSAFSHPRYGVNAQVMGFVNYCLSDTTLLEALRKRDWYTAVTLYNGDGQQKIYVPALDNALVMIRQELGG